MLSILRRRESLPYPPVSLAKPAVGRTARAVAGFLLSFSLARVAFAQAGPPMLTDDPGTAPKGMVEWNTAVTIQGNQDGSSETLLPLVDVSYGLTEKVELNYESHWTVVRRPGEAAQAGWDDTTLAFKWRFADEDKQGADISFQPQYTFNTGQSAYRRGILNKNSDLLLPFELGKTFDSFVINVEVGRDFHAHQAAAYDYWFAGLTFGHKFTEEAEGILEFYMPDASRDFGHASVILNVGVRYDVGKNSSIIVSTGAGIAGSTRPKIVGYYGYQIIF